MNKAMMFVLLGLALGSVARADPISISPGETVTVQFDGDRPVVVKRSAAPPITRYESELVARLQRMSVPAGTIAPAVPIQKGEIEAIPPAATAGQISLTFRRVASLDPGKPGESVLTILDGYDSSFRYRATMYRGGRSSPTDVCNVEPRLVGAEHWPYVIDRLEISDLKLEPATGEVTCE